MSHARVRAELLSSPSTTSDLVERGRWVLRAEMQSLARVADELNADFARAVTRVLQCTGTVIVTGIGKAGIIGQKLAASLSSTGTPSHFMHPADAVHGDLGCVRNCDIVILLSYSGETDEVTRLLPVLRETAACCIAITSQATSTLATQVDLALLVGEHTEACPLQLAPSCTTTAMLAVGDALALVVSQQRGLTREQFARVHPAGGLGKQLTKIEQVMRPLQECRVAAETETVRQVLIHVGRPGRRTGAIMLTDAEGCLAGIFTDSDLARLLESCHESRLDHPISAVMTRRLQTVTAGCYLPEALRILAKLKISELPVVTDDGRPLGIVDITDVMSVLSDAWSVAQASTSEASATDGPRHGRADNQPRILPIAEHLRDSSPIPAEALDSSPGLCNPHNPEAGGG